MTGSYSQSDFRFSVAPMLDWTDRHFRYFMRGITRNTWLYTEMIPTGSILFGDRNRFLHFDECEHPLVLQLGGSNPAELGKCARIAADYGFDEINLNVGCPSDKVVGGNFGASLMDDPELVAECIESMQARIQIPVTIKCRIGISPRSQKQIVKNSATALNIPQTQEKWSFDENDYELLKKFINLNALAGCKRFIIHARIAVLGGLSPKANRSIPPLHYELVHRVKQDFFNLAIELNGGLMSLKQAVTASENLDGAMIGRAAYDNSWIFANADQIFISDSLEHRFNAARRMIDYIDQIRQKSGRAHNVTRHMLGLFHGCPGARKWRQILSDQSFLQNAADASVIIETALAAVNTRQ